MLLNFSLNTYYHRNCVHLFGLLLINALILFRCSEATKYEFDGCDMPDHSPGVCRVFQDCSVLIDSLKKGDISIRDPVFCGYKGAYELICCPTDTAVVTPTTTPLIFDESSDVTTRKSVDFWEPLLTTAAPPTTTSKPDFWLHLLNSSTSTTAATATATATTTTTPKPDFWLHLLSPTTTTTTPKPLVFGDQELDTNSKFYDFSKLLKDGQKLLPTITIGTDPVGGFVNGPQNTLENRPHTAFGNGPVGGFVNGPQNTFGNRPQPAFGNGPVDGFVNGPIDTVGNRPQTASGNGLVVGFVNGPIDTVGNMPQSSSDNGLVVGFVNGPIDTVGNRPQTASGNGFMNENVFGPNIFPGTGHGSGFGNVPQTTYEDHVVNGIVNRPQIVHGDGVVYEFGNDPVIAPGNGLQILPGNSIDNGLASGFENGQLYTAENSFGNRPNNDIGRGLVVNQVVGGFLNGNLNGNMPGNKFGSGRAGNGRGFGRVLGNGFGRRLENVFGKDRGNGFGFNSGRGNDKRFGNGDGNVVRNEVGFGNERGRGHGFLRRTRNGNVVITESEQGRGYGKEYGNNVNFGNIFGNIPENRPQYLNESFSPDTQILPQVNADFVWPDQVPELQPSDEVKTTGQNDQTSSTTTTTTTTTAASIIQPVVRSERPAVEACRIIEQNLTPFLTPHILDGTPVEPGAYPHMAAIGYSYIGNEGGPYDFRCGGTLIHERFILTAAHCVNSRNSTPAIVRLGVSDFDNAEEIPNRVEISIKTVHIPDDYSSIRKYHDIALLELANEVKFSNYVYPACLYTEPDDPPKSAKLYVTGWGTVNTRTRQKSNILLKARLEIEPLDQCNNSYMEYGPTRQLDRGILSSLLCARDPGLTKDACQGDSGGPLNMVVDETTKNFRIVGVISSGFGCASSASGLYTRVSAYLDYIENIVWPTK